MKSRLYYSLMSAKEYRVATPAEPGMHFNDSEATAHTTADLKNVEDKFALAKALVQYDDKSYSVENFMLHMYDVNTTREHRGVVHESPAKLIKDLETGIGHGKGLGAPIPDAALNWFCTIITGKREESSEAHGKTSDGESTHPKVCGK